MPNDGLGDETVSKNNKVVVDAAAPATEAKAPRTTKVDTVVAMLKRAEGADVTALAEATGWQVHSVRGAIAGQIKKKLGLIVTTAKVDGKTIYRIAG